MRSRRIARCLAAGLCALSCALLALPARAGDPAPLFSGVIVPMFTPYRDERVEEVDLAALREFTAWLCAQRVSALFPVSGMGQWQLLALEEKKRVLSTVLAAAGGRKPVIAGVGGQSAAETLELARHAVTAGAQAIGVVTPSFLRGKGSRLSQDVLFEYYAALARSLPPELPILVYDAQGELRPDTMRKLAAEHPGIQAIKYRTDSAADMARMVMAVEGRIAVISGIEFNTLSTLAVGGVGVIGGGANAFPDLLDDIFERFRAGDMAGARAAQRRVIELYDALGSSVELKFLLRELAGLPIAYSDRSGSLSALVPREVSRDPAHLARLKQLFADVIRPATPKPRASDNPRR